MKRYNEGTCYFMEKWTNLESSCSTATKGLKRWLVLYVSKKNIRRYKMTWSELDERWWKIDSSGVIISDASKTKEKVKMSTEAALMQSGNTGFWELLWVQRKSGDHAVNQKYRLCLWHALSHGQPQLLGVGRSGNEGKWKANVVCWTTKNILGPATRHLIWSDEVFVVHYARDRVIPGQGGDTIYKSQSSSISEI